MLDLFIATCPIQSTPSASQWDETPGHAKGSETPGATPSVRLWDATPGAVITGHATPATPGKRNRWDATPQWGETPKVDGGGLHLCASVCVWGGREGGRVYDPMIRFFCLISQ